MYDVHYLMFDRQADYWSDFFKNMDDDSALISFDYSTKFDYQQAAFAKPKNPTKAMKKNNQTTKVLTQFFLLTLTLDFILERNILRDCKHSKSRCNRTHPFFDNSGQKWNKRCDDNRKIKSFVQTEGFQKFDWKKNKVYGIYFRFLKIDFFPLHFSGHTIPIQKCGVKNLRDLCYLIVRNT